MAFGRKVRVRRFKVEDGFEGEAYYVSPFTGGLFVFALRDLKSESLRRHARCLGIKLASPLWTHGEFREDPTGFCADFGNCQDVVGAADFGRWVRKTAVKVGALRAVLPLLVLVEACRRRRPFAQKLSRNECLRAVDRKSVV